MVPVLLDDISCHWRISNGWLLQQLGDAVRFRPDAATVPVRPSVCPSVHPPARCHRRPTQPNAGSVADSYARRGSSLDRSSSAAKVQNDPLRSNRVSDGSTDGRTDGRTDVNSASHKTDRLRGLVPHGRPSVGERSRVCLRQLNPLPPPRLQRQLDRFTRCEKRAAFVLPRPAEAHAPRNSRQLRVASSESETV
jgi:hypothetical protein